MFNLKRLLILAHHDWLDFWASKSWMVVLILPLFISFIYAVIYREAEVRTIQIAYYAPLDSQLKSLFDDPHLRLKYYPDPAAAERARITGTVVGVLAPIPGSAQLSLQVDQTQAPEVAPLINAHNLAWLDSQSDQKIPQIRLVYTNSATILRWSSLPIWLLQIILTICLLQAAAAVADQKDRQLNAILVSPVTWGDYLDSKLIWNSLVGCAALGLTLILTGAPLQLGLVLFFGWLGSIVYSAGSILIGLFSPSALFARTIATLVYIISALPLMLQHLTIIDPLIWWFFPSYLIWYGFQAALSPGYYSIELILAGLILLIQALVVLGITNLILKKADF